MPTEKKKRIPNSAKRKRKGMKLFISLGSKKTAVSASIFNALVGSSKHVAGYHANWWTLWHMRLSTKNRALAEALEKDKNGKNILQYREKVDGTPYKRYRLSLIAVQVLAANVWLAGKMKTLCHNQAQKKAKKLGAKGSLQSFNEFILPGGNDFWALFKEKWMSRMRMERARKFIREYGLGMIWESGSYHDLEGERMGICQTYIAKAFFEVDPDKEIFFQEVTWRKKKKDERIKEQKNKPPP